MLYFRMVLIMLVSLYTVRIVLNTLGIIDYGIFEVVGGLVMTFSFLSNTMSSAAQRFFAFELGRNNNEQLRNTFSLTVTIHAIIALTVLLLAETLGLWFLNSKLVIPPERMEAANWIYQFSILSFLVTIITIPYNAAIIAHENMKVFAYVSIIEVVLKLIIVYVLILLPFDKLKIYSCLFFLVTCTTTFIYRYICRYKYIECHFHFFWNKRLFKTMVSYSGWNLFGAISAMANDQGLNILLNVFFGPVINAARAIAYRVNGAISSLYLNFYVAVNPQIIKSYAANNNLYMKKLVFQSSKFAYYLLLLLAIPFYFEVEFILKLWLKTINESMVIFTRLIIFYALVTSLESPLTQAARATGKIKKYQIVVGSITLLTLPVSFILFKVGFPPEYSFYTLIIIYFISIFVRLWVLKELVDFPIVSYLKKVLLKLFLVSIFSVLIPVIIKYFMNEGWLRFLTLVISSIVSILIIVYYIGLTSNEKNLIVQTIKTHLGIIFRYCNNKIC